MVSIANTVLGLLNGAAARGRIEQCCGQLNWPVDERDGKKITLYFNDNVVGQRNLYIRHGDEPLVLFAAYSHAILPESQVPDEIAPYLLLRNAELGVGKWEISKSDENEVFFAVVYWALGGGIDAAALKYISESLIREANQFDAKMQRAGLLRV